MTNKAQDEFYGYIAKLERERKYIEIEIKDAKELYEKIAIYKQLDIKAIFSKENDTSRFYAYNTLVGGCTLDLDKYMICPKIALSAFLKNKNTEIWYLYNTLFVDFLIIDKETKEPFVAIEIDDESLSNYQKAIFKIKQILCKKAGIIFVVLESNKMTKNVEDNIKNMIDEIEKANK